MNVTTIQINEIKNSLRAAQATCDFLDDPKLVRTAFKRHGSYCQLTFPEYQQWIKKRTPYFQGRVSGIKATMRVLGIKMAKKQATERE